MIFAEGFAGKNTPELLKKYEVQTVEAVVPKNT